MAGRVLIVATSHSELGNTGKPTGCWVEEVASPYYAWKQKGYQVTVASIKGGEIPFDPASEEGVFCTPEAANFQADKEAQELVKNSKSVAEVLGSDVEHYDALFLPGGHGIVYDGPQSNELKLLIEKFWAGRKVVSAVCHGPAGLVTACSPDGNSIVKGKRVTGFTNSEEIAVQKQDVVPFLLEDRLKELGGIFERGDDWAPHVVSDGNLITGQNPGSSKAVAEAVIAAVTPPLSEPVHGKGEGFHHRAKMHTGSQHHDHQAEHPRPGVKKEDAAVPVPEAKHRSSWHQTYRPPI